MTSRPIVVGYDASEGAEAALGWALDEGWRTGAPVLLVYVFEWLGPVGPIPAPRPDDGAERIVSARVGRARTSHPQVTVAGTVASGPATAVLVDRSEQARLMVLGSRGHGGFTGLLLGSTSINVSAHAHSPVVVVRQTAAAGDTPVVVGVDGSACSLLAADFAFAEAATRKVSLRVLSARPQPAPNGQPPEIQGAVAPLRDKYPQVSAAIDIVDGPAGRVMAEASHDAQLVVVGTRGMGQLRGTLLGSVSQQLLHHAHCPVAVVREQPT
ncbi:universal stress protein [Phytohabitans flavus]|uniref:Universal stress protein n=1 Tax=Phytohabitans flavus TaxID=1076124 RepID=A0A6F8XMP0_9ACTN|nr:universal stress protein [Phytohabitans flavus]BCB75094.1 universal stress protein [Phytohabitans flavus]